jgi:hypothetical protein
MDVLPHLHIPTSALLVLLEVAYGNGGLSAPYISHHVKLSLLSRLQQTFSIIEVYAALGPYDKDLIPVRAMLKMVAARVTSRQTVGC